MTQEVLECSYNGKDYKELNIEKTLLDSDITKLFVKEDRKTLKGLEDLDVQLLDTENYAKRLVYASDV